MIPRHRVAWSAVRIDWVGGCMAVAALAVFLLHGFQASLDRDLAVYAYGGQQVLEGVPPYVSILNRAGPLAHLIPAFGAWGADVVGIDDLLGMRLVMMVVSIGCVWAVYLVGRDIFRSRLSGVVSAVSLLTFQGFVAHATGGPREKTTMLLFLTLTLWCIARRRWGWAGACVALATLAWQPAFFVGATAALVGMATLRGRAIMRALAAFGLGGAIPTAACVIGFWMAGALREMVDGFLLINAEYTVQPGLAFVLQETGLRYLRSGFGWSLWLFFGGLILIVVAALTSLRRAFSERDAADAALVAAGAACVASIAWSFRAFNNWPDAVVALPMAALGIGFAATVLAERFPDRIGGPVIAAAAAVALLAAAGSSYATKKDQLGLERRAVRSILAIAPDDSTVMSIGAPQPLVFAHLTNPTRHQMFTGGLAAYVDDSYPGGLPGYVASIEAERPTFITFDDPKRYPWMLESLGRDYARAGRTPRVVWFVRKDVGRETIRRLRRCIDRIGEAAREVQN